MIRLYIGDVTDECCKAATEYNTSATLLTSNSVLPLTPGVYYTSLGDLENLAMFVNVLRQSDEIYYVPPESWSDNCSGQSWMKIWTEFYLQIYYSEKTVVFSVPLRIGTTFLDIVDTRRSSSKQLWVAGCSISHGVGVNDNERYGEIIANQLDLPVSFLTKSGSSIVWQADQILRSDIQKGDILIWGITSVSRLPYLYKDSIQHLNSGFFVKHPEFRHDFDINRLSESDLYYRSVTAIYQVLNFCNKIGVKLYIAGLLVDEKFLPYLFDLPNYTQMFGRLGMNRDDLYLDLGTDNDHPGPLTHKCYAEILLKSIKRNM